MNTKKLQALAQLVQLNNAMTQGGDREQQGRLQESLATLNLQREQAQAQREQEQFVRSAALEEQRAMREDARFNQQMQGETAALKQREAIAALELQRAQLPPQPKVGEVTDPRVEGLKLYSDMIGKGVPHERALQMAGITSPEIGQFGVQEAQAKQQGELQNAVTMAKQLAGNPKAQQNFIASSPFKEQLAAALGTEVAAVTPEDPLSWSNMLSPWSAVNQERITRTIADPKSAMPGALGILFPDPVVPVGPDEFPLARQADVQAEKQKAQLMDWFKYLTGQQNYTPQYDPNRTATPRK